MTSRRCPAPLSAPAPFLLVRAPATLSCSPLISSRRRGTAPRPRQGPCLDLPVCTLSRPGRRGGGPTRRRSCAQRIAADLGDVSSTYRSRDFGHVRRSLAGDRPDTLRSTVVGPGRSQLHWFPRPAERTCHDPTPARRPVHRRDR